MGPNTARSIATGLILCLGATPGRAGDPQTCDPAADILVIYDCDSGLVLWSRRDERDRAPDIKSPTALCRLVRPPAAGHGDQDACL